MDDNSPFEPDWVSPPGDTITSVLEERGIAFEDFAQIISCPSGEAADLINGRTEITEGIAQLLAKSLGATEKFWLKREKRYRSCLERLQRASSLPANMRWLDEIPAIEMEKLGWLTPARDKTELVTSCLRFFGVPTATRWRESYKEPLTAVALRTSKTFRSQSGAVAAWLRQGEILASEIACGSWDRAGFQNELANIRPLTRIEDPKKFLPELITRCAAYGVAVVVLRAPKQCKASGASRFLSSGVPLILLSGRHLSDDHLWFTFFHEAGHLILHGERFISVDGLEGDDSSGIVEENEANEFAFNTLIPPEYQPDLMNLTANKIAVLRFARRVGVSRGIVVGQLQNLKIIKRNYLNKLKHFYTWD